MQKTRNNCFGSKNGSTSFHQAKIDKPECRNIIATYVAELRRININDECSIRCLPVDLVVERWNIIFKEKIYS